MGGIRIIRDPRSVIGRPGPHQAGKIKKSRTGLEQARTKLGKSGTGPWQNRQNGGLNLTGPEPE